MVRKETPEDVKRWFQEAVRDLWPCGRRIPDGFRQCNIGKATISSRLSGEATQLRSGNADLLFP